MSDFYVKIKCNCGKEITFEIEETTYTTRCSCGKWYEATSDGIVRGVPKEMEYYLNTGLCPNCNKKMKYPAFVSCSTCDLKECSGGIDENGISSCSEGNVYCDECDHIIK